MPKYRVTQLITVEKRWEVEANSQDDAIDICDTKGECVHESQINDEVIEVKRVD